jgi:hypothetical protein
MILILMAILLWIPCSILAFGMTLAYFQREYPIFRNLPGEYTDDLFVAWFTALLGPVGPLVAISQGWKRSHGLMYRRKK